MIQFVRRLLKGMTLGSDIWLRTDVVSLQFAIQGRAADPEHLPRHHLVPIHLFENALNGGAFDIF